jgi:hypothetical protein
MAEKNIKKETKKKKSADAKGSGSSLSQRPIMPQPELIKKKKKDDQ